MSEADLDAERRSKSGIRDTGSEVNDEDERTDEAPLDEADDENTEEAEG
ncbi:MAG: hypothetical protein ACREBS_09380 [Nitrososphaerales archaeon]